VVIGQIFGEADREAYRRVTYLKRHSPKCKNSIDRSQPPFSRLLVPFLSQSVNDNTNGRWPARQALYSWVRSSLGNHPMHGKSPKPDSWTDSMTVKEAFSTKLRSRICSTALAMTSERIVMKAKPDWSLGRFNRSYQRSKITGTRWILTQI
jgi:hypothetical protein